MNYCHNHKPKNENSKIKLLNTQTTSKIINSNIAFCKKLLLPQMKSSNEILNAIQICIIKEIKKIKSNPLQNSFPKCIM